MEQKQKRLFGSLLYYFVFAYNFPYLIIIIVISHRLLRCCRWVTEQLALHCLLWFPALALVRMMKGVKSNEEEGCVRSKVKDDEGERKRMKGLEKWGKGNGGGWEMEDGLEWGGQGYWPVGSVCHASCTLTKILALGLPEWWLSWLWFIGSAYTNTHVWCIQIQTPYYFSR